MKSLRKLAGITIFFILVFMVVALFRYQRKEEMSQLPEQIEYYLNEGWEMTLLEGMEADAAEEYDILRKSIADAYAAGAYSGAELPFSGKCKASDVAVFRNMLPEEWAGLTMNFASSDADVRVALDGEVIYEHKLEDEDASRRRENMRILWIFPKCLRKGNCGLN